MYCPKCGQEVGDYTQICPACGELLDNTQAGAQPNQPQYNPISEPPMPKIPDYKVQSILLIVFSCILCCVTCLTFIALPFAIVALVNSNKVGAHLAAGNYDLARKASEDTKKWCWVSFGILIGTIVIGIVMSIVFINSGFYKQFINEFLRQYEYYDYDF